MYYHLLTAVLGDLEVNWFVPVSIAVDDPDGTNWLGP